MRISIPACHVLTLAIAMASATTGLAADLDIHLWRERVLLVFAPRADHPDYVRLARELDQRAGDLQARRLVVYRLFLQGDSRSDREVLETSAVADLRRRLGVTSAQATLILVGKDGGEKLRAGLGVVDLDAVFRRIDAMPMRRLEMKRGQ